MLAAFACLIAVSSVGSDSLDPRKAFDGKWWVNANHSYGYLIVELGPGNELTGTFFDQPIRGSYDPSTQRITFTRHLDANDADGRQEYTGILSQVPGKKPANYVLQGTFRSLDDPAFGKPGETYPWSTQAVRLDTPAEDLDSLQGDWVVSGVTPCMNKTVKLPDVTQLNAPRAGFTIRGNQLLCEGTPVATLANDVRLPALEREKGFEAFRLLVLTLPDGRALVCSYWITEQGVELAYPHTTACHRGSGEIVYLKRPAPKADGG